MRIIQYKICLLGDFAVGKTSLVRQYVEGRFDNRYLSTIGVKISRRTLEENTIKFHLLIWDLAGGDAFVRYQNSYLGGSLGAIIVFDLTRRATLDHLADYVNQVSSISPGASIVFVGNKSDLGREHEVHEGDIQQVLSQYQAPCLLTSAKTGEQVDTIFQVVLDNIRAKQSPHVT